MPGGQLRRAGAEARPPRTLTAFTVTVRKRLAAAHERIDRRQLPALSKFDPISGLTGLGVYLLHRNDDGLLRDVLAYLVRLTDVLKADGDRRASTSRSVCASRSAPGTTTEPPNPSSRPTRQAHQTASSSPDTSSTSPPSDW
jgi:hypothetical protein